MKAFVSLLAVLVLASGCATQRQVANMQGSGSKQVFRAPFDQVWRAAVDAAQAGELEIVSADRTHGYIASKRGIKVQTFGENVGIWVSTISPTETQVEVVSRHAGPPKFSFKNWENQILNTIQANLTRDAAVGAALTPADELSGSGSLSREETRVQAEQRLKELRREEELKHDALLRESDVDRKAQLNREIDDVRSELRRLENRLSDLETQQKNLR
jgi:hypothetical protein